MFEITLTLYHASFVESRNCKRRHAMYRYTKTQVAYSLSVHFSGIVVFCRCIAWRPTRKKRAANLEAVQTIAESSDSFQPMHHFATNLFLSVSRIRNPPLYPPARRPLAKPLRFVPFLSAFVPSSANRTNQSYPTCFHDRLTGE